MSGFASSKDLAEKKISFEELGPGLYGFTAEGDPNSGVVIGDRSVLVVDAQATPRLAEEVLAHIRKVTDKPVKHVALSHYHAVRVLGASAYKNAELIASDVTRDLIAERGQQDMDSEIGRFPRLFRGKESIPSKTWNAFLAAEQARETPDFTIHILLAALGDEIASDIGRNKLSVLIRRRTEHSHGVIMTQGNVLNGFVRDLSNVRKYLLGKSWRRLCIDDQNASIADYHTRIGVTFGCKAVKARTKFFERNLFLREVFAAGESRHLFFPEVRLSLISI